MSENNPYNTESYNKPQEPATNYDMAPDYKRRSPKSHIWLGAFLLIAGGLFLLKRMGVEFPDFVFSWQMFLIGLGIYLGVRKDFQGAGWLVLILIGSLFMINEFFVFGELRRYILPIILIGMGLFVIFKPKRARYFEHRVYDQNTGQYSATTFAAANATADDFFDSTSVFGGAKKKVFSKSFKGGDLVNIFGGSEIDLTQADFTGTAKIDATTIFGGATILVPSNWNVVSNAVAILGEVKDKRPMFNRTSDLSKTLIIDGTVIFGGIDIKSY